MVDPIAAAKGEFRACWANTGRLNFAGATTVENSAVHGEALCVVEEPNASATTGTIPVVTKFVVGNQQLGMPDNVAFQPHTGNLGIQHRAVNDAAGAGNHGALIEISGFKIHDNDASDDDHGNGQGRGQDHD